MARRNQTSPPSPPSTFMLLQTHAHTYKRTSTTPAHLCGACASVCATINHVNRTQNHQQTCAACAMRSKRLSPVPKSAHPRARLAWVRLECMRRFRTDKLLDFGDALVTGIMPGKPCTSLLTHTVAVRPCGRLAATTGGAVAAYNNYQKHALKPPHYICYCTTV